MKKIIIIFLFFSNLSINFSFGNADKDFQTANQLYGKKEYESAKEKYLSIEKQGMVSPDLYKNIGNCYYQKDEFYMAILYYERALKLDPANEDIRFNLKLCNTKIVDKNDIVPEFFLTKWWNSTVDFLSEKMWTSINLILFIFLIISISLFIISRSSLSKKIYFVLAIFFLLSSVLTGFIAYQSYTNLSKHDTAIVSTPVVEIKSSPDEKSKTLFNLHQGTKLILADEVNGWFEIKISNGNKGWVKMEDFVRI